MYFRRNAPKQLARVGSSLQDIIEAEQPRDIWLRKGGECGMKMVCFSVAANLTAQKLCKFQYGYMMGSNPEYCEFKAPKQPILAGYIPKGMRM